MLPYLRLKHMGYNIAVVHQDPLGIRDAFDAQRGDALGGQDTVHVISNRPALAFGVPGTDDKIIGDRG